MWLSELKHFVTSCSLRIYVSLFNDNLSVNIVLGNAKEKEKKKKLPVSVILAINEIKRTFQK